MKIVALLTAALVASVLVLPSALAAPPNVGGCNVFPADHIWNTPIDTLPLDGNSSAYVTTIGAGSGLKADFGAGLWDGGPIGIPFVTVPGSQPKYPVDFDYADESDPGPYAVPLNAPIEGGPNATGDRHAISIDTTNCILYELYGAYPGTASWSAGSGAIYDLKGYGLRPAGWTSADAAGLPIFPGLVRYDEILAGEITHAIRFTVPQTRNTYVWPARHKASNLTGSQYPPMGQRFRLKASFDISTYSATNQVILRALKKYGMILADNGSAWYMSGVPDERWNNNDLNRLRNILGSNFEAVNESSLMISANSGQARQSANAPVPPQLSSFSPSSFPAGSFTLTVNGNGFQNGAVVKLNGNPLSTTFTSSTRLTATGTATAANNLPVQVLNPDGGASNILSVTVSQPASPTPSPTPDVAVTVSPTDATVRLRRSQRFTATVSGSTNKAVVWAVNGVKGGNSTLGTISSWGLYTAPDSIPSAAIKVTASSVASPTVSASANVRITRR